MSAVARQLDAGLTAVNGVLWHPWVLYVLLGVGILLTIRSGFCQFRALTHGTRVLAGRYDDPDDPGAITHLQALSTALSATVGVGNIGGVALAISIGGPGAVLWMWVVGFLGMAIKSVEVTLSMLYRRTSEGGEPHGGPMWVARDGFAARGLPLGAAVGAIFSITLLTSTMTGGNFFQAWNVAHITERFFGVDGIWSGLVLTGLVGLVVVGGIRRIGQAAGRIVPFMCGAYLLAAVWVIVARLDQVPAAFGMIFAGAFGELEAQGAFLGGTAGWAFAVGLQRAFFSNESGQGSSPIAHSAARTDEPAREGLVAGLEPFIDTLVVCTLTSLVILLGGAWNRDADLVLEPPPPIEMLSDGSWTLAPHSLAALGTAAPSPGERVVAVLGGTEGAAPVTLTGHVAVRDERRLILWDTARDRTRPTGLATGAYLSYDGAALTALAFDRVTPGLGRWLVTAATWLFALSTMISWSYYGEQGVVFLLDERWVPGYRMLFCAVILLSSSGLVSDTDQLNNLSLLGTGTMLFANIPLTLLFAGQAIREQRSYLRRMAEIDQGSG